MKPELVRVAAYGVLVEDDRILLARISRQVPEAVGQWTLPGGGLEFGEQPEDAVVREVYEETGLSVVPTGVINVHSQLFDNRGSRHHMVRILYRVRSTGGTLRSETVGSTDLAQWFTLSEANAAPLVEVARLGVDLSGL